MGVIYKLKKEVIDYILDQKRVDPDVGCRQLAQKVGDKFQIFISKSSVNAVIKSAQLSNHVGRPAVGDEKRVKKFEIPQERKKALFKQLADSVGPIELPVETPVPLPKKVQKEIVETKIIPEANIVREAIHPVPPDAAILPEIKTASVFPDMGSVFLTAILERITLNSLFQSIFKNDYPDLDPETLEKVFNMLVVREASQKKEENFSAFLNNEGIKAVHGLNYPTENYEKIHTWIKRSPFEQKGIFNYLYEREQRNICATALKISLEDKTEIFLDPFFLNIWPAEPSLTLSDVLPQTMELLSSALISNNRIAVLGSFPGDHELFYRAAAMFENFPGSTMTKISVMASYEEIAQFNSIPHKQRDFVAGLWPADNLFNEVLNSNPHLDRHAYHHLLLTGPHSYTQTFWTLKGDRPGLNVLFTAIALYKHDATIPTVILLTNQRKCDPQKILDVYINIWPNLENGVFLGAINLQSPAFQPAPAGLQTIYPNEIKGVMSELIQLVAKDLTEWIKSKFFPENPDKASSLLSLIYSLDGTLHIDSEAVYVRLKIPSDILPDLVDPIRRFNESRSLLGQRHIYILIY